MMNSRRFALAACVAACIGASATSADARQDLDPRVDAETGRDRSNWPPDRLFDHLHMRLELDIADMGEARFSGRETLTLAALGAPRTRVRLNADSATMTISRVTVGGVEARFTHADNLLAVDLPTPAAVGRPFHVRIDYAATKASREGSGLNWIPARAADDRRSAAAAMAYSQGESEWNHLWFPCHDFPNEKLTTETVVTVPDPYEVVSNGRLVGVTRRAGRSTFHWVQDKPHANYLVMIAVSQFDVVSVGGPTTKRPGLWIPVYGPVGSSARLKKAFANTPEMIAHFESLFDEPYPWDKYAQVIVRNFRFGGMENTSATTLAEYAGFGERGAQDSLISHELGHQWFGDLTTCKSWEHLWLNEGWASMCEALWDERQAGRSGYQRVIQGFYNRQSGNRGRNFTRPAMVSNRYGHADEAIMKEDDVYSKGAMVLHMLRQRLGSEAFFKGTALYLDRHKFTPVETSDFRRALEEVSGQSLERFFEQWAMRPGAPRLEVDLSWDEASRTLRVVIEQTQPIDADNPAYAFELPLYVEAESGKRGRFVYVPTDQRRAEASFVLDAKPSQVSVDPNLSIMAAAKIRSPLAWSVQELRHGLTIHARARAAESLAARASPIGRAALLAVARDRAQDSLVRSYAAWASLESAARLARPAPNVAPLAAH
ncbi:MAG: hypothetical protein JNM07_09595 [Phycisphaerae bacterium]|nr:hypothetical protein [Phycisphaerae bacterium]